MSTPAKLVRFQLRRNSAERWTYLDPVLLEGEPGVETDTGRMKIGDGISSWSSLRYTNQTDTDNATFEDLEAHVNSESPHPVYDDGPSLLLLYQNAKV